MAVTKMHGARNDFVILDQRVPQLFDRSAFARSVCDRHSGIGADGVLVVESSTRADAAMRVINADGGEAEMCGNGIRCVARFLDEAGAGDRLSIETIGGIIETEVVAREPEYRVRAAVGVPRFEDRSFAQPDSHYVVVGNPHVVIFRATSDAIDVSAVGDAYQRDPQFSGGINVHTVVVESKNRLRVWHYERGVGLTMACGTGSVGCAAAAIATGRATSPVEIIVPGGRLIVEWDESGTAYMTGPAVRVFETEIDLVVPSDA